jgi:DNA-binding XRE family transcriptional regulator
VKETGKKRLKKVPTEHREDVISDLRLISDVVKERRMAMGYTQEALAEALGIAPITLQFIEQQRRYPSLPLLLYIFRYLELKLKVR